MTTKNVTKAVIPAAGLGTRFLPATKTVPKELLPLITKPTLQFVVEEAYQAGVREFIFIISPDKPNPASHFQPNPIYQKHLEEKGKADWLKDLNEIIDNIEVISVEQKNPLGLGHAVLMGKEAVGDDPFLVLLPDVVIDAEVPCSQQLIEAYAKAGASMSATEHTPKEKIHLFGVYDIESSEGRLHKAKSVVEKPATEDAPSDLSVVGRYLFTPDVFELLEKTPKGKGGEVQLADAQNTLAGAGAFYAYEFAGRHFDTGDPEGYLKANIHFGIKQFGKERVQELLG